MQMRRKGEKAMKTDEKLWILLVDDDEETLHIVTFMLFDIGFGVVGMTDGGKALEFLKNHQGKVDAVVLDLSLPVLDGLTVAEQIRFNEETFRLPPVPIAFYTGHHQQEGGATERVAAKCNVEKIFHKPDDTPELGEKIKEWLETRNEPMETENYVL